MALSHLLDTSVYCQPLKPIPVEGVVRRWRKLGDKSLAISVVCEAELRFGLEWKASPRLQDLYAEVLQDRLRMLDVTPAIATAFGSLKASCRRVGLLISDFDIVIAATASLHGLTLATLNTRHFTGIPGLVVEDWGDWEASPEGLTGVPGKSDRDK